MRRYPELQNIGLIELRARPGSSRASKPRSPAIRSNRSAPAAARRSSPSRCCPAGRRPFYCFAVAGLARNLASYLPAGLDYCALERTL